MSAYSIPNGYSIFIEDLEHIAQGLRDELALLQGSRLFITGATGFFGIWLLEGLLWLNEKHQLGMRITGLSRDPKRFLSERAPHLQGRLDLEFLTGVLTDFRFPDIPFTHIIHAASETDSSNREEWAARHLRGALDGTRRILDLASQHKVRSVLVTTSGAVYSTSQDRVVDLRFVEGPGGLDDMTSERYVYGQAKRMMEIMLCAEAAQHDFTATIARCFAFVGPYLPLEANYAIGNFIRDALEDQPIVVAGDGAPLRSYLYAADLVVWLVKIMVRGGNGVPYNVGGTQSVSIGELAHLVADLAGYGPNRVEIRSPKVPGAPVSAYLPDLTRMLTLTKESEAIDLREAIARTMAWNRMRTAKASA